MLMLSSTIVLIATVTPFALPPLLPILLLFYFIYLYFQASTARAFNDYCLNMHSASLPCTLGICELPCSCVSEHQASREMLISVLSRLPCGR